jgi:hypothetical protein
VAKICLLKFDCLVSDLGTLVTPELEENQLVRGAIVEPIGLFYHFSAI